jgi:uncharacterized iron-regulated membrane protein
MSLHMTGFARLRRLWLDVHLWIGVGLAVLLIPVSVTGAALVWHDGLERAMHPARFAVTASETSQPVAALAASAKAAFAPGVTITQVRMPQEPGDPAIVSGRLPGEVAPGARPKTVNAWIDPADARVLETADPQASAIQIMHRIHGSLMVPGVGRKIVGWLGWAMFVSCATGLWLWWPRNGALLKALRWRRGASTLFNLHHFVGFWICLPLAVLSLTGVYISFPQTSLALKNAVLGQPGGGAPRGPQRRETPAPIATPALTPDAAAAKALAGRPGAVLTGVTFPTAGKEPAWRIALKVEGAKDPETVQVVDATGKVKADRGRQGPDPTARLMRRIHDGTDMGIVWQTVVFLGGVAPAVLGVTGLVMWLRRRRRRLAITHLRAAET